jgi:hypothetical protein
LERGASAELFQSHSKAKEITSLENALDFQGHSPSAHDWAGNMTTILSL